MKIYPVVGSDLSTSGEIWRTLVDIGRTNSRTEKIAILKAQFEKGNTLFKWVLKVVFDNTINFGIVLKGEEWFEFVNTRSNASFTPETIQFLVDLAEGLYTRKEALYKFRKLAANLGYDSLRLLVAIINKNIEAGINASTINLVWRGLIPTFPYMRCSLPTRVDLELLEWDVGVYAQEKADGMFANINVGFDCVTILSRQGTEIPIDKLGDEIKWLSEVLPKGYQVHGEMLCRDPEGRIVPREIGNGVINSCTKGGSIPEGWSILFRVWDAIPLTAVEPKGKYTEPYSARFQSLKNYMKKAIFRIHEEQQINVTIVEPIETKIVHSIKEAKAFYRYMIGMGKEGAILKNPTAIWRDGVSKEQVKLKIECDCDLKVIGFIKGEGKYKDTLGSLICESADKSLRTNVSGFSDSLRKKIWECRTEYLGMVATVKFNDVMQKEGEVASLFLPRFVEFREDKVEADSFKRILEIRNTAIMG